MDEPTKQETIQLELLAKIHNQLVDLKNVILEIELANPSASHAFADRLRRLAGDTNHVDTDGRSGATTTARQQKVIAPTTEGIQPGEATK